jgi:hypothetical protein
MANTYHFDQYKRVQSKVKLKNPYKLSRQEFFDTYGSLIFQKYVDFCNTISCINMDSLITPYIKVNFFSRQDKKTDSSSGSQIHMLHNEVKISEVAKVKVRTTNTLTKTHTMSEKKINKKKKEVTYIPRFTTSIEKTEIQLEEVRSHIIDTVVTTQGSTAVYCNLVFSEATQNSSTQCEPQQNHFAISRSNVDIPGEYSVVTPSLTACSTSSIHISAADHFVQLDSPKKPMYRHIKAKLGLGKLVEKPESIREMWLAQEIAMLRGQNLISWESKTDQLMEGLFQNEQSLMTIPEVFTDHDLSAQIVALTSDKTVMDMTSLYFDQS